MEGPSAISVNAGTLVIHDSMFANNTANNRGGAISANNNYNSIFLLDVKIYTTTFESNKADYLNPSNNGGGAIMIEAGTLAVHDSNFVTNNAGGGGAIKGRKQADIKIYTSTFERNSATQPADCSYCGVLGETGGAITVGDVSVEIHDTEFISNMAGANGGAITLWNSAAEIYSSTFERNIANLGGAIYVKGSPLTMDGCSMLCSEEQCYQPRPFPQHISERMGRYKAAQRRLGSTGWRVWHRQVSHRPRRRQQQDSRILVFGAHRLLGGGRRNQGTRDQGVGRRKGHLQQRHQRLPGHITVKNSLAGLYV
jgi:hypothetical protein